MATPKGETKSRVKLYEDAEIDPPYPGTSAAEYLLDIFIAVGPTGSDGPISFQEIEAYSRLSGTDFDTWEVRTLSEMSRAFRDELNQATDPLSIEPMEREYD